MSILHPWPRATGKCASARGLTLFQSFPGCLDGPTCSLRFIDAPPCVIPYSRTDSQFATMDAQ